MSAIGRYVHLSAAGYNESGINKPHQSYSISPEEAYNNQKTDIEERIKSYKGIENVEKLEKEVNELISTLGDGRKGNKKNFQKETRRYIEDALKEQFSELQKIDWNNITVNPKLRETSGVGKLRRNYLTYKNWKKEIVNRVNELNYYLENYTKNTNIEQYEIANKKIKKIIEETYSGTYNQIQSTGKSIVNKKTVKNMIKALNEIIEEYASMPALNLQSGSLFEHVLSTLPAMSEKLEKKEIRKTLEDLSKNIVGGEMMSFSIDESNFNDSGWKIKMGDITEKGYSSQNKIDIQFEWEGQQLNVSAKNLDLGDKYKFVHTTQGNSLLYMLQDENSDFVNHYLNLFSHHEGKGLKYTELRTQYFNLLKLILSYKAITGDSFGRGANLTNVFIVNNKTGNFNNGNRVKVVTIASLLNKFMEADPRSLGFTLLYKGGGHNKLYTNKRVEDSPSGAARIANLLNEVHQRKISISFNSSLL